MVSLITNFHLSCWGTRLTFECVYDPLERKPYKMFFQDCNNIEWFVFHQDMANDSEADLIDIQLEQDKQPKTATICTDIFELSFVYGTLKIEKNW